MPMTTWITMILIMGFVWGGFGVLLFSALRKEKRKGGQG
jgi:LPS O-antigen subunit length determinant protein (WzzB/FepE family)